MHYFFILLGFLLIINILLRYSLFRKNNLNKDIIDSSIIEELTIEKVIKNESLKDERTIQLEKIDSYLKGILIAKQQKEKDLLLLKELSEKYPKEALEYLNLHDNFGMPFS